MASWRRPHTSSLPSTHITCRAALRLEALGFGVESLGFGVRGLGFGVWDLEFRAWVQGVEFRLQD